MKARLSLSARSSHFERSGCVAQVCLGFDVRGPVPLAQVHLEFDARGLVPTALSLPLEGLQEGVAGRLWDADVAATGMHAAAATAGQG